MAPKPPGDRRHLEQLLTTWSHETDDVTAGRLRNVVGVTVIAQMLDGLRDVDDTHLFAFKGGAGLQMRYGLKTRATKDLDAAYRDQIDTAVERLTAAIEVGWSGFDGVVANVESIARAHTDPLPIRMKIKLRYRGRSFVTIPFEVSPAEASSVVEPEIAPVAITLERVQLEGPDQLPFLPLRYQIAQKLHACSEPSTDEHPNDRARDLVDLDLIEELSVSEDDLPSIRDACLEIFESRQKHPWPPTIVAAPGWNQLWERLAEVERLEMSLDEAIADVNDFIGRIAGA